MAATVPASLKTADIQRFATRAAQLEKFRPIVSYWCNYYIVQKILGASLHTSSDEAMTYTTTLMDKLETAKSGNAEDAILDDVAAKAYIENFALETFQRADNAQTNNQVTKQTADTFQAAITFIDLMTIWGPLDQELSAKSKFAKFHAVRIVKAIMAGQDPNETNPKVEPPPQQPTVEDGDELDVEMAGMENDARNASGSEGNLDVYHPPTVESAPESKQPSRPGSTAPPILPVASPNTGTVSTNTAQGISPVGSADDRQGSIGGGYFPSVPASTSTYNTATSQQQSPDAGDTTMPFLPDQPAALSPPTAPPSDQQPFSPSDFYNTPAPQLPPSAPASHPAPTERPHRPPPEQAMAQPTPHPISQQQTPAPAPAAQVQGPPPPGGYRTDDDSTMAAQKHAKWAISALNFEDVGTAVKELRLALESLGAS
ncbi:hypothetical protein MBLNU230_g3797t1 [Neophaeotheca triangularis]